MGDNLGSDPTRSFPGQLRRLLEAAGRPQQDRAWADLLDFYSRLILSVARQVPRDDDVITDRCRFAVKGLREQSYRRLRTFAADGRGTFAEAVARLYPNATTHPGASGAGPADEIEARVRLARQLLVDRTARPEEADAVLEAAATGAGSSRPLNIRHHASTAPSHPPPSE